MKNPDARVMPNTKQQIAAQTAQHTTDGNGFVVPRYRKIWHACKTPAIVAGILLTICGVLGAIYASARGTVIKDEGTGPAGIQLNISRAVDSPIGFIPGFDVVTKGKAKISIDGIGVTPKIEKEVAFYVQEDGSVAFDMLPDDPSVEGILEYVTEKQRGVTYDPAMHGASRFMKLDFMSLFNLNSLVSTYPDLYGGLLTAYTNNTSVAGAGGKLQPRKGIEACDSGANTLSGLLAGASLNTQRLTMTNTTQSIDEMGNALLKFSVEPSYFANIDTAITTFITACYIDGLQNGTDTGYLQQVIEQYTTHPTYMFTVKVATNGTKSLTITASYANPETQASQKLTTFMFELLNTGAPDVTVSGAVKSFFERPNLYGLVYSYCRVPPLVARDSTNGKLLITRPYSTEYAAPTSYDLVYACTNTIPQLTDYAVPSLDTWIIKGKTVRLKQEASQRALKQHAIAVAIESYFVKNGYYPSIETVQAGQLPGLQTSDLQDSAGNIINKGDISYSVEPENCSECVNYTLQYVVDTGVTLQILDYARQGADR